MKDKVLTFWLAISILFAPWFALAQVNELPRTTPEAVGVPSEAVVRFFDKLTASPKTEIHSAIILKQGKVIGEIYPKPFDAVYKHTLYSCSKTFVSLAVGMAIDENRLRLTDRVAPFFPEYLPSEISEGLAKMTIYDLLIMSSGITPNWSMRSLREDWIRSFLNFKVDYQPGTEFHYDSMATYMLCAILQRVTSQTLMDYLETRLWKPLHITEVEWELSPEGVNTGGWGAYIQSESLAKFGQLLLNGGEWNGKRLVSESWVKNMMTSHIKNQEQGYGFQMWPCKFEGSARAAGAFGQHIYVIPTADLVVVITQLAHNKSSEEQKLIEEELISKFHSEPLPEVKRRKFEQHLKNYELRKYEGKKQSKNFAKLERTFVLKNNKYGWKQCSLSKGEQGLNLHIVDAYGDYVLPLGYQTWTTSEFASYPYYSITAKGRYHGVTGPFYAAGNYAWTDANTLEAKIHFVNWISAVTLRFEVSEDVINFVMSDTYSPHKKFKMEFR